MWLGEQQGKKEEERIDKSRTELKEKEGIKGASCRLNELRVDLPSSLPRVCIVGTGIFSRLYYNYKDGWDQGWAGKFVSRGRVGRGEAKNIQGGEGV